jgi:hypothetical protein
VRKTIQFFLRCNATASLFYSVEVHPTKKSLVKAINALGAKGQHALDSRAVCLRFTMQNPHPQFEQIGTIFFVGDDIGLEVVMHELAHAVCGWARKIGIQPIGPRKALRYANDPEERFAHCLQYLTRQFLHEAQKHKLDVL